MWLPGVASVPSELSKALRPEPRGEGAGKCYGLERPFTLSHVRVRQGPSSLVTVTLFIWGYVLVSQEEKALLRITKSSWLLWHGRGVRLYVANTGKASFLGAYIHVCV